MFLSMAPEHPYVHGGVAAYAGIWGAYLPMINTLRSQLDVLHTQLYNNGCVTTPAAAPYNGQCFAVDSVDNLVASVKMLVEGFQPASPGPFFNGLSASQVAFGVPSGPSSSNPPYISTTTIEKAYDCITSNTNCGTLHMNAVQPNFRGVMSWSINWDAYDVAHNTAGRVDFANIKSHMGGGGGGPVSGQTYKLVGKQSGKCVDVPGGSTSDGTFLIQWTCNGGSNQSYLLTDTGGGQYTLKNSNSGKCLDIPGGSTTNGTGIEQWTCNNGNNQKFTLGSLGNGYYKLVQVNSGQCMDVAGQSTADNAAIDQWPCNGQDNQAFQFQ
jgi:hypothetical protein